MRIYTISSPRFIKKERYDGVLADILRDVLFGIVCTHLFLVDILFKDVAKHIRVNFVVVFEWAVIKMPLVLFKESKKFLKGCVRYLNGSIVQCLKLMFLKDAAVEVRDFTEQSSHFRSTFVFRFGKSFKEKWA